jgi:hypothetical protein
LWSNSTGQVHAKSDGRALLTAYWDHASDDNSLAFVDGPWIDDVPGRAVRIDERFGLAWAGE